MRRASIIFCVLCLGLGSSLSAGGNGAEHASFPVSFTMTHSQCGYLPVGAVITGAGTEDTNTVTQVSRSGIVTLISVAHAKGTATDADGNTYEFNYSNQFKLSNSLLAPTVFSGEMTDSFNMAGNGPAGLHNGFNANITIDFSSGAFSGEPKSSRGDPIDFATGTAHCDPL
jgi:hypothetical protein